MKSENKKYRGQIRGYLFERIICLLLERNDFVPVRPDRYNKSRVRRARENSTELKGRGGWHQIDCPFEYGRTIPFLYPIRLIGEVRYHQTAVGKDAIRSFIGVLRDIQENYFIDDSLTPEMVRERRMEIGVFFSANGFVPEAERLAYSHGIRTISYKNNPIILRIREYLDELETRYIGYDLFAQGGRNTFLQDFEQALRKELPAGELADRYELDAGAKPLFAGVCEEVSRIRSSFIATTNAGVVFHFLGTEAFPEELFAKSDRAVGQVYFEAPDEENRIASYLRFADDGKERRFYFTLPEGLGEQAVYGMDWKREADQAERVLHVMLPLSGIQRSLTIALDTDRVG